MNEARNKEEHFQNSKGFGARDLLSVLAGLFLIPLNTLINFVFVVLFPFAISVYDDRKEKENVKSRVNFEDLDSVFNFLRLEHRVSLHKFNLLNY